MSKTPAAARVVAAQARAEAARANLSETIGVIQKRANPQTIASDVVATLKTRGTAVMQTAMDTAEQRPWATVAGVALTSLFLARGTISRLFRGRDKPKR
ncbi:DUF3618 domain-containing protein [Sphingomonas sp. TREG-RG-20F-R18-01]|uniref:DUF3618 domain-containing protein n=1 Tax=Sphingomonas sp. TREG-RG-20F-R18-01 TaxID=2914982 RepID=UPI001F59BE80|nr:DUF3618 domain-containing protein [Sphingomonas sp. TREG-RG-20F-R18-01]